MAYEALYTRARPKTLSQLVGQEHISNTLLRAISGKRLSHAYLLVGTRGTGKTTTARLLAKAMNCETVREAQAAGRPLDKKEIPCNKCDACRNFDSSPDNLEFDAASNRSVEDITRLLSNAYLAPLASHTKTFIIDEIHMLSNEAINSILKLIEEPPPNVAFFLATTEINKVPMTIRSRCQVLNFRLIPQSTIAPYLQGLARRLDVKLQEEAAKKIARQASGSMRDALTYLDQCYAMADSEITLANVYETLGLVSDEDLDAIISAVRARDRKSTAEAITRAFNSGASANLIAESLITRLRDLEFTMLERNDNSLSEFDGLIDALRKSIGEMYGSGIPDIILEMTLLKLAAPAQIFMPTQTAAPAQNVGNLDEGKKIFYHVVETFGREDDGMDALLTKAVVVNFSGDTMTLGFRTPTVAGMFEHKFVAKFEQALEKTTGHAVKLSILVDKNLPAPILDRVSEPDRTALASAIDVFGATDATKL